MTAWATSVPEPRQPPSARRRWIIAAGAAMTSELALWVLDQVQLFLRAHAANAWFGLLAPRPMFGVHVSIGVWLVVALLTVAVVRRRAGRVHAAATAGIVLALGFGTMRATIERWRATPVAHAATLVPVCEREEPGELTFEGRNYVRANGPTVLLEGARARWNASRAELVVYLRDAEAVSLGTLSELLVRRHGTRCASAALTIDGETASVAQMNAVLLLGVFDLEGSDAVRLHRLYLRLTE